MWRMRTAPRAAAKCADVLARPLEMVKQATAEHGIKRAMGGKIADVVLDELEIRELNLALDVPAALNILVPHLDPCRPEPGPGKSERETAFEAAQIYNRDRRDLFRSEQTL